jgi:serine/threonine protein kinase
MDQKYRREQLIYKNLMNRVEVYKVMNTTTGIYACMKIISTTRPEEVKTIKEEYYAQASLQHPNICQAYEFYEENCQTHVNCCIVVEYLEGDLLKDIVNRKNQRYPFTELELWNILLQVSSALTYAKLVSVAHRDIKPANILLSFAKECKVADFGTAKSTQAIIAKNTVVGTPMYLSPQIREGLAMMADVAQYNPYQADVYSLGVMMLYLATLEPPKTLSALDNLEGKIEQEIQRIVIYSEDFKWMLRAMLRVREEERALIEKIEEWSRAKLSAQVPAPYSQTVAAVPEPINAPSPYGNQHLFQTVPAVSAPVNPPYPSGNGSAGQYLQQPPAIASNRSYPGVSNQLPVQNYSYMPYSAMGPAIPTVTAPSQTPSRLSLPSQVPSTSPFQMPAARTHSQTTCVKCKKKMLTSAEDRIPLPCGGILCSSQCFRSLIPCVCPVCRVPFDPQKYQ